MDQRLRYLIRNQARLDERLLRVENSVLFRFLRWIGGALGKRHPAVSDSREYEAWIRETQVHDSSAAAPKSRISLILAGGDAASLQRTIASIDAQDHPEWELYICGAAPAGLASPQVKIVAGASAALDQITSPLVGFVGAGAILEPGTIRAWIEALEALEGNITAVYSDWDLIASDGRRHSPRFTPEFSPELLLSTPYWGCCFAAQTAAVRKTGWTGEEYDLSRRLGQPSAAIARIPQILWHLNDAHAAALERPSAPPVATGEIASIIICSRNPERLEACLSALRPTIDARHQIVVVTHDDSKLDRVAERHGVANIPFSGAFHFGRMNRLGASLAHGSVLVLLNDDVRPVAPGWLESIVAQAARPGIGAVGALLLYPGGAIQHAGIVVGGTLLPAHAGRSEHESLYWPWLRMTREVSAVTGACLAIRRSVWDELGGFDLRFPVNYNDVDLCLRAQQRGLRVIVETRAVLTHQEAATRVPSVRPEESELFWELWGDVLAAPDPFFNPQLELRDEMIRLPLPWPRQR